MISWLKKRLRIDKHENLESKRIDILFGIWDLTRLLFAFGWESSILGNIHTISEKSVIIYFHKTNLTKDVQNKTITKFMKIEISWEIVQNYHNYTIFLRSSQRFLSRL